MCVNGGAGGISQPMSTLMTMKVVTMPMVPPSGVVSVLPHLEYPSNVFGYAIDLTQPAVDQLRNASLGCHLVLISADVPRYPGMARGDLWAASLSCRFVGVAINAGSARGLHEAWGQSSGMRCPLPLSVLFSL